MTATTTSTSTSTVSPTAPVASVVTPYLTIAGAAEALDWYTEALGAVEAFRVVGDDGRIGHSELSIGGARVMISDDYRSAEHKSELQSLMRLSYAVFGLNKK